MLRLIEVSDKLKHLYTGVFERIVLGNLVRDDEQFRLVRLRSVDYIRVGDCEDVSTSFSKLASIS